MSTANFKKYKDFIEFITDFLLVILEEGFACAVINYEDYQGLVQALQEKVVNGKSLTLDVESLDNFDEDIEVAKNNGGNIIVSVFKDSSLIIGEPMLYLSPRAYAPATYFVEYDAKSALDIQFDGTVIPFMIEKEKI